MDDVVLFACGADADLGGSTRAFPPGGPTAGIDDWLRGRIGR